MPETVLVKSDLVRELHNQVGLNQREAKEFTESFFEVIREALEQHEPVKISGFGRFSVRHKFPRPGRNPKTGTSVTIKERSVVIFRASNQIRKLVHDSYKPS